MKRWGDGDRFLKILERIGSPADPDMEISDRDGKLLQSVQDTDGSWNFLGVKDTSGGSDTNSTAIAIQALAAAGVTASGPSITRALAYLAAQQLADGNSGGRRRLGGGYEPVIRRQHMEIDQHRPVVGQQAPDDLRLRLAAFRRQKHIVQRPRRN